MPEESALIKLITGVPYNTVQDRLKKTSMLKTSSIRSFDFR